MHDIDEVTGVIVDCAYRIHLDIGPGLLESAYEPILERALLRRGLRVERQKSISFEYDGMLFQDSFRLDLFVNELVVVELKSVETIAPVHLKQVLTYLRLLKLPVGLLINFGANTFKDGARRVVNKYQRTSRASDRLPLPGSGNSSVDGEPKPRAGIDGFPPSPRLRVILEPPVVLSR